MCRLKSKNVAGISVGFILLLGVVKINAAQGDWKEEWEKTVQSAKREGEITIYIGAYEGVLDEFKRVYPEIRVSSVTGGSTQMATRILAERRAGKYLADVFHGGVNTQYNMLYKVGALDPLKPLFILPEVVDRSRWLEGYHFADPEDKYIFPYVGNVGRGTYLYNVNLFDPKEVKSNWDLLKLKLKGKIVSLAPTDTRLGAWMIFLYYHRDLGPQFIRKFFGDMDITYSKDQRQMTDWLAAGKYVLCVGCRAYEAKKQGLPVDYLYTESWREGGYTIAGIGALGFVKQAPHPNAAKVFVNWFLSRAGQIALQKTGRPGEHPNSRRIDIPKESVSPEQLPIPGSKYVDINKPDWQDLSPIFSLAKQVMAESKPSSTK
jgi:iron(III) transport system substrate-binding protein